MKYIGFILLCLTLAVKLAAQAQTKKEDYPFKEKVSFDGSDCDLAAEIEVDNSDIAADQKISLKYIVNVSVYCPLYNPFFNPLIPAPGQIALYDENKKYVTDLTKRMGGSRRSPGRGDWLFMYGGFIGSKKSFIVGDSFFGSLKPLKEGKYFLQMIFYRSFYSVPWEDIEPKQDKSYFYKTYDTSELLRSNAVEINDY